MANIHATAIIEQGANIGANVEIGPFCYIGPQVTLGDGCVLQNHVSIMGDTTIGSNCRFSPFVALGGQPQNKAHKGGPTAIQIGNNNDFREGVTVSLGTDDSRALTTIGDNGLFMAYCHIGHDCIVGNNVTFANGVLLGGHAEIGDFVVLSGGVGVHQFARVGHHAFGAAHTGITEDLIPYGFAIGYRSYLGSLNIIGMKRSGMPREDIHAVRRAVREVFNSETGSVHKNALAMQKHENCAAVADILDFLLADRKRRFIVPLDKSERGIDE